MHSFRKYLSTYSSISDTEWELIASKVSRKEYESGDLLLEQGEICKTLYFVESGFLRFYVNKEDGEQATKFFTQPPYCFTSQRSFTALEPSAENIEVLETSVIWEMNQEDAFDLLKLTAWSEFVRKLVQEVQYNTEQILQDLQNRTAEERYIEMLETKSPILQKSPLKYIASYLGIAPQSLSRIRRRYMEQQRS